MNCLGHLVISLLSLNLLCVGVSWAQDSGLQEESFKATVTGEPILWHDFASATPAEAVAKAPEPGTTGGELPKDCWTLRHPNWTPDLLNARGLPPDLTLDPGRTEVCDVYLGLRAVDPTMTFGIRLSSEKEFTVITAPAATPTKHFDFEFHWKAEVPMAGEKIVLHSFGKPVYVQYLRFVPQVTTEQKALVPTEHVSILAEKGRHFAFPGVAQTTQGDLLAVAREGDAHVCPRGRIVVTRSTDLGKTWSPREVLYDSPSDDRDPAILCLRDGALVASFCTWDSWRAAPGLRAKYPEETANMEKEGWNKYSGSWTMVSTDGGKSWSEAQRAPTFSPRGPVQGPDGALYWVGDAGRDGANVVSVWRSEDVGKTWTRFSEVCYGPGQSQADKTEVWDEPNLILLPDGRAICSLRVEYGGWVWQAASTDGGRTWGWPRRTPVWGFPQQLCRLADGRLVMSYGYRRQPFGVRACLSKDEGRTWDLAHEIVFRHGAGHADLGYPYSIQLADGRVFTAYYYNDEAGDCYIEGVAYRP